MNRPTMFGWSYPPGAANDPSAPYNQDDPPFELAADRTLIGYGRKGHGLNGKDADLNEFGQNVVEEALWFRDDGAVLVTGRRYASVCPPVNDDGETDEAASEIAQELVIDCDYPGEWDGDYWSIGESYSLRVPCQWDDALTEEQNLDNAKALVNAAIDEDSALFEQTMRDLNAAISKIPRG